jgi:RND superfamily putative drug exporter
MLGRMKETGNLATRAARWSAAHRRAVVLGWLAFVFIAFAAGAATGMVTLTQVESENGQSRMADETQARQFPRERAGEQVLIESPHGPLAATGYRRAINELVARLARTPSVTSIQSPLVRGNAGQFSRDGRAALVTFQIAGDPDTAQDRVAPALAATAAVQRAHPDLFIGELGAASTNKAVYALINHDFQRAEATSVPVTLLILVLAFGALAAAGVPMVLGFTAVAAALGLTEVLSHLLHVEQSITSVILLIGLAVGIDYSLFYVRRVREERAAGRTPSEALEAAAATSGRAVLISGFTVAIAMMGMFLVGNQVFTSFGMGTVLVVLVALAGSLTVLPAVLAGLGDRVDRGRLPGLSRIRARNGGSRFWAAVVGAVLRRPLLWGGGAAALLVALALPAFSLHTVSSGMQGLPRSLPVARVYDRVQRHFPGGAVPETVVVTSADITSAPVTAGIRAMERAALATGRMYQPISVQISTSDRAARVSVALAGTGTNAASVQALALLRDRVIPATIGRVPGVTVHTTGETGQTVDFNNVMKSHAPYVFVFVLGLAFLLLLVTFRSVVIPLTAIALNLLSVGAAYGVLVLIFQQGHLESLLHFRSIGGVTNWLPLFLFVILFGLSMDYHVFILSRIREAHDRGMSTENAVAHGITATAGVVTSAAMVMVAVFAIFSTLDQIDFKMVGVGLAAAILIDATIVRAVLVPTTMKLLGDWNWYLPRWLEWLPRVRAGDVAPAPVTPTSPPRHEHALPRARARR